MSAPDSAKPVALVIDDEVQSLRRLKITLEPNGYKVCEADNGQHGIVEAASRRPDIVLLDLGLPDMDGVELLKRLREWSRVPVVVLSVRDREEDKVAALDHGADDFVTKPFGTSELLARMRAALRHAQPAAEEAVFKSGDLEVDFVSRVVKLGGREVKLTATEYALLRLFVMHAGKVLTHKQILREVWGPNSTEQTHYLRVYMAHLREKLEKNASAPRLFTTEPGIGYRFVAPE